MEAREITVRWMAYALGLNLLVFAPIKAAFSDDPDLPRLVLCLVLSAFLMVSPWAPGDRAQYTYQR
jgi:hypothetical protein